MSAREIPMIAAGNIRVGQVVWLNNTPHSARIVRKLRNGEYSIVFRDESRLKDIPPLTARSHDAFMLEPLVRITATPARP